METARRLQPGNSEFLKRLAAVLECLGYYYRDRDAQTEALTVYQELARLNPSEDYHSKTGFALMDLERWPEAESEFREAIRLHPSWGYAYRCLGFFLKNRRKYDDAEIAYKQAIRLENNETRKKAWQKELDDMNESRKH